MKTDPHCRPLHLLLAFPLLIVASLGPAMADGPAPELTCPSCEDFDFCTIDSCDTTTGTCRHDPRDCADSNPCTTDSCVDFQGVFPGQCNHVIVPAGTTCSDGNPCSVADSCQSSGLCVGAQVSVGDVKTGASAPRGAVRDPAVFPRTPITFSIWMGTSTATAVISRAIIAPPSTTLHRPTATMMASGTCATAVQTSSIRTRPSRPWADQGMAAPRAAHLPKSRPASSSSTA